MSSPKPAAPRTTIPRKHSLLLGLSLLLCLGFFSTTLISYHVSRNSIRESILTQELPLTSDNIYSEILKDLVRPVFISSMMASDTFLRDWTLRGERDPSEIKRYLKEVMARYGAFTSFFVSETTRRYYHPSGLLKNVREDDPLDAWYFRVRRLMEPYEINVDPDMANHNLLTIFINYRVLDYRGNFLGTAGVGLAMDSVRTALRTYQQRFGRSISFVDPAGRIVLYGDGAGSQTGNINEIPGLRDQAKAILTQGAGNYQYVRDGETHLLNVRFIPELKWFLFVEKAEDEAMAGIRHTLYVNLAVCALVTLLVVGITGLALSRYQERMEELATTDKLTGLLNRQSLDALLHQAMTRARRTRTPLSLLLADVDHFKAVNDAFGHLVGDEVLKRVAANLSENLRASDTVCRWGGEEFLVIVQDCDASAALNLADKLRTAIVNDLALAELASGLVTISVGVAELHPKESEEALVGRADAAMYAAKEEGRNCVRLG
jgi:diguanylate cyclase (GGDEF)-like protein